jgi:CheY-like chemotaxis protein
MTPPPTQKSPFERPPLAARFKSAHADAEVVEMSATPSDDVVKLLAEVLRHADSSAPKSAALKRAAWNRRKALVCVDAARSEEVARGLVESDYEVFVAGNTAEALGRMREDRIDVVVVDGDFDPVEQGFAFVTREVKLMLPSERRRLFLVYVTPNARTMDLHAAFLHNANLVVNPDDIARMPEALEVSLRYYNELYRELNHVLALPPI